MRVGLLLVLLLVAGRAGAQDIIGVITEGITKVIRAVDLEIQRMQTRTIVLEEAQKEVENAMSALRLGEIQDWVSQQKELYAGYFQELLEVKAVVGSYHKVGEMIERQKDILVLYSRSLALFRQDRHFSAAELGQIEAVLAGIVAESAANVGRLTNVIASFAMQVSDQDRMAMIDAAAAGMDRDYRDIQVYINESELISLQRASDENDYQTLKELYGL